MVYDQGLYLTVDIVRKIPSKVSPHKAARPDITLGHACKACAG